MGARHAALFLCGLGLVLLPVGLRNLAVGGEFHLTTSQFGPNFFIGNNPTADGIYAPLRPGGGSALSESSDAEELAVRDLKRPLGPGEVSWYWTRRALSFITGSPGQWLRLMARKALLVWNRIELSDTEDQESYADWSVVLGFLSPLLHFGVLAPLAAAGLVLTWRPRRRLWVLYAVVAVYAASVIIFYVFSRYRFPLVPPLILLAAGGIGALPDLIRRRRHSVLAAAGGLAVLVALPANWPMASERVAIQRAVMQNNIGVGIWNQRRSAGLSLPYFQEAIRLDPAYSEPYKNLGMSLRRAGRPVEALAEYRRALRLEPDDPSIHEGIGVCLTDLGRTEQAADSFRRALALNPAVGTAHWGLAVNLQKLGLIEEARAHFMEAARIDPLLAGKIPESSR